METGRTDNDVSVRCGCGENVVAVIVALYNLDLWVPGRKVLGYIAKQHGDFILGMMRDDGVEDGATDVSRRSSPIAAEGLAHAQVS